MTILEASGLEKRFGGLRAVAGMSLHVEQGEILGLFGPNGAGKTTVFNLVAGSLRPDAGSVVFRGQDITRLSVHQRARRGLARTFQIVKPLRELSVLENVLVPLARNELAGMLPLGSVRGKQRVGRAAELLERVGLADRREASAGSLTLGLQKRLEVARALALDPVLLLLDEPLAGLTRREAQDLLGVVSGLGGQVGVVLVEHNVRLAMSVVTRAMVMDAGEVIATGEPDAVRRDPAVIEAYLGTGENGAGESS